MLAQLAARMQVTQDGAGNGEGESGLHIVVDDNCLV